MLISIIFLTFILLIKSISSFVISSLLLSTYIAKSTWFTISFDLSTPIFSTISSVSLIPAVSIKFSFIPSNVIDPSTISLVVPAIFVTIAFCSSNKWFSILLFPTFGLPIIATSIPFFNIEPSWAVFDKSSKSYTQDPKI